MSRTARNSVNHKRDFHDHKLLSSRQLRLQLSFRPKTGIVPGTDDVRLFVKHYFRRRPRKLVTVVAQVSPSCVQSYGINVSLVNS